MSIIHTMSMAASMFRPWADVSADLPASTTEATREAIRRATAHKRAEARKAVVARALLDSGLVSSDHEALLFLAMEWAGEGGQRADADATRRLGMAGNAGIGTARAPWAAGLGKGRRHASDGPCWDRAIQDVALALVGDAGPLRCTTAEDGGLRIQGLTMADIPAEYWPRLWRVAVAALGGLLPPWACTVADDSDDGNWAALAAILEESEDTEGALAAGHLEPDADKGQIVIIRGMDQDDEEVA